MVYIYFLLRAIILNIFLKNFLKNFLKKIEQGLSGSTTMYLAEKLDKFRR